MNDNLSKPITIIRAEFISNLVDLINNSMLPPFIMESIFKDVYFEIKNMAQNQYKLDVEKYEQLKRIQQKEESTQEILD